MPCLRRAVRADPAESFRSSSKGSRGVRRTKKPEAFLSLVPLCPICPISGGASTDGQACSREHPGEGYWLYWRCYFRSFPIDFALISAALFECAKKSTDRLCDLRFNQLHDRFQFEQPWEYQRGRHDPSGARCR